MIKLRSKNDLFSLLHVKCSGLFSSYALQNPGFKFSIYAMTNFTYFLVA